MGPSYLWLFCDSLCCLQVSLQHRDLLVQIIHSVCCIIRFGFGGFLAAASLRFRFQQLYSVPRYDSAWKWHNSSAYLASCYLILSMEICSWGISISVIACIEKKRDETRRNQSSTWLSAVTDNMKAFYEKQRNTFSSIFYSLPFRS